MAGVQRRSADAASANAEIVAAYPYPSDMPHSGWWELIERAERQIDLLGYTLYFLPMDHPRLVETIQEKCANGCKVRVVIADPESKHVADRDDEEDLALNAGRSDSHIAEVLRAIDGMRELRDAPARRAAVQLGLPL
ncbi:hypothetical protein [Planosporangium mesophilum]|uniref:Uncharacterized protein n=1 Tax=Planosporangium mesophilum TaxID=689768 RepID=A0A8J3TBL0_9ACTN|nr:hypothetical protein [Planosporangium mesophilum]NJC83092.1 hypothetical protein [Planosporangium mesophilum]GII22501.1 hypothetical protein Pme01_20980 [Planosporangium mesophilum]